MLNKELQHVLTQRPLGLVFDFDGTLSEIAPTPSEARLYAGVADLLTDLQHYAEVAILTGRAVADGADLINLKGMAYIGTHGLEWSEDLPAGPEHIQLIAEAQPYIEPGQRLLDLVQRETQDDPGIIVQRKSVGGSIHYRQSADPIKARQLLFDLLTEPARQEGMLLGEGKLVVEVLAPLKVNKGEALRRFVQRKQLRGVIFAGDDRTDLYAIREIPQLRQEGIEGHAIVVQHADTPSELLERADEIVLEVHGMVERLKEIHRYLATMHNNA
ncbi:trehalose-phosphatase [Ktedonospora formicarum]|uniref:Trehalose 6-phosphate phosphatase n=1 Tax=Ktedonospora formicarum TaxID=2778364 RepID=A0A8J3MQU2_9CHLR|nr:trehalose-phosphatase [Ktedonospora formicarum]GHO44320.1 trehalose-phosphatase [Ktedonospora formicarum]